MIAVGALVGDVDGNFTIVNGLGQSDLLLQSGKLVIGQQSLEIVAEGLVLCLHRLGLGIVVATGDDGVFNVVTDDGDLCGLDALDDVGVIFRDGLQLLGRGGALAGQCVDEQVVERGGGPAEVGGI